jgi:hypothetical protein
MMFQLLEGEMERGVNPSADKRFFFKREVQAADMPVVDAVGDAVHADVPQRHLQQQQQQQQRLAAPAH